MKNRSSDKEEVGYIGIGRSITEEETRLASEHFQAYKAKAASRNAVSKSSGVKAADAKNLSKRRAEPKDAMPKKFDLDDIGHIGGEQPYTDEDARMVSAHIQAEKAKRMSVKKSAKRASVKRKARVKKD